MMAAFAATETPKRRISTTTTTSSPIALRFAALARACASTLDSISLAKLFLIALYTAGNSCASIVPSLFTSNFSKRAWAAAASTMSEFRVEARARTFDTNCVWVRSAACTSISLASTEGKCCESDLPVIVPIRCESLGFGISPPKSSDDVWMLMRGSSELALTLSILAVRG